MNVLKSSRRAATSRKRSTISLPPELENGDKLTAREFLRRYEAMPGLRGAQLIESIVYMPSPVRVDTHGHQDGLLHGWLFIYAMEHPDLELLPNTTLLLDDDNIPQPDVMLCSAPKAKTKGRTWLTKEGYLAGKPELVCEVASSSASVDMNGKLTAYRRNGIQEYLVWLVKEKRVLWHKLGDNGYELIKEKGSKLQSEVFPGLVLDVKALLKGDKKKLAAALKH